MWWQEYTFPFPKGERDTVRKHCHNARQKPSRVNLKSSSSICGVWRFNFKRFRWLSSTALLPAICTSPLSWFLSLYAILLYSYLMALVSPTSWESSLQPRLHSHHFTHGLLQHPCRVLLHITWHQQLSETMDKEPRTSSLLMSWEGSCTVDPLVSFQCKAGNLSSMVLISITIIPSLLAYALL